MSGGLEPYSTLVPSLGLGLVAAHMDSHSDLGLSTSCFGTPLVINLQILITYILKKKEYMFKKMHKNFQ
jgi:hypothetical protein